MIDMLFLLLILCFVKFTHAQIGVTVCTAGGTECAALPNSICDQFNTLKCVCSTAQKYQAKPDNSGCDYILSQRAVSSTGTGTLQTSVATYTCSAGYKLTGVSTRTCVLGTGWSDTAPTCVTGKVGDSCATVTYLCVNLINAPCTGGTCTCLLGYTQSSDTECVDINECSSSPCQNGGVCNDGVNGYTCSCAPGYTGSFCETNINECSSSPCKNGAKCNDYVDMFNCSCGAGFTGHFCETDIDECASNPCRNGASCINRDNSFTCSCVSGFNGVLCEEGTAITECPSHQNGIARTGEFREMMFVMTVWLISSI